VVILYELDSLCI